MAHQTQNTESLSAMELIAERGLEGLPDAAAALINVAIWMERERHLGARRYERAFVRSGYANGYKTRSLKMRLGELSRRIPQVRKCGFYAQSLEKRVPF